MGIPIPVRRYIYIKTPQLSLLLRAYTKNIDKYETTSFGTVHMIRRAQISKWLTDDLLL